MEEKAGRIDTSEIAFDRCKLVDAKLDETGETALFE